MADTFDDDDANDDDDILYDVGSSAALDAASSAS